MPADAARVATRFSANTGAPRSRRETNRQRRQEIQGDSTETVFGAFEFTSSSRWPISNQFRPPISPALLPELLPEKCAWWSLADSPIVHATSERNGPNQTKVRQIGLGSLIQVRKLTFRRASLDDAQLVSDLRTVYNPDEPSDPQMERYGWMNRNPDTVYEDFIVVDGVAPCGNATLRHKHWELMPKRFVLIEAVLTPKSMTATNWKAAYALLETYAVDTGARIAVTSPLESDTRKIEGLEAIGYVRERLVKAWQLDLVANRQRLLGRLEESRAHARSQGVTLLTLAQDTDPDKYRKLHEMTGEAGVDEPSTVPYVPVSLDFFMKWVRSPIIREDRFWIARMGDRVVGLSVLAYPPVRGHVWTSWTITARAVRGRGLARALKLETVGQAIGLGVTSVRTSNDGENAPILHLNEQMGYQPIPGLVELHKTLVAGNRGC